MVCAPVRSIIPSLKLGDYLSVQAHNPCSISHLINLRVTDFRVSFAFEYIIEDTGKSHSQTQLTQGKERSRGTRKPR